MLSLFFWYKIGVEGERMEEALNYLKKFIHYGDNIVVAVSGGPDSMALLTLVNEIKKNLDIGIICAHVNHNVREESAYEKKFVEEYCDQNHIIFEYMKIENYGDDNFHNEARTKRYHYFEQIVKKYNAHYLLTAHHADDLMETILMRLVRGSTLRGYSGFSKVVPMEGYQIIRPLIQVPKTDIYEYCKKNKIEFVQDKSNDKDIYTRNRFRKYVVPTLRKENPEVEKKFYKFSTLLLEYDHFIDDIVKEKMNDIYKQNVLNIEKFKKEKHIIQLKIIYSLLEQFYQEDLMLLTDKHAELILNLINSDKPNLKIHLPNNVIAKKAYDVFTLEKEREGEKDYEIEMLHYANLPNGHNIQRIASTIENGNDICRLNSKEVKLPLYIRNRKEGDKMMVKGMIGSKKIKEIFIENKITPEEREVWPVVVDAMERIVWLPGLKKSKFDKQNNEKYDIILKYY